MVEWGSMEEEWGSKLVLVHELVLDSLVNPVLMLVVLDIKVDLCMQEAFRPMEVLSTDLMYIDPTDLEAPSIDLMYIDLLRHHPRQPTNLLRHRTNLLHRNMEHTEILVIIHSRVMERPAINRTCMVILVITVHPHICRSRNLKLLATNRPAINSRHINPHLLVINHHRNHRAINHHPSNKRRATSWKILKVRQSRTTKLG